MHYCEGDKSRIIYKIDSINSTIFNRLLPVYNDIEREAKEIEKNKLEELSKSFNPEIMDPEDAFREAWETGAKHYTLQHEMKQEFLLSNATWLFHLFEKDCIAMFDGKKGEDAKNYLINLDIDTNNTSNWSKINNELRHLANTIKHGDGSSSRKLRILRSDFFDTRSSYLSNSKVIISSQDLESYINKMKDFWDVFFDKVLPKY